MKNYSLALWGWAARWLAHIWVIKYLEEQKTEINEVSGTSMWAIVAAMLAIWKTSSEMQDFANELNLLKLVDPEFKTGLLKWKKIKKKLEEIFWKTNIEDTKIPLRIVATNIEQAKSRVFDKWSIIAALRASISLPWIFTPQKIQWEDYVDWGIMMNLPIEVLDGEDIIAVSALKINTWEIRETKKIIWFNFKSWFFKNNYEIIKRSVIAMMKVNEDNSLKTPWKNIQLLRPDFWKLDIIDFNKVDEFVEIGYSQAKSLEL